MEADGRGTDRQGGSGPSLDFESSLTHLVEQAEQMRFSQRRMRDLVRVNNELTSHLDLPTVLRRIVEIGVELVQALGVAARCRRASPS